jgi:trimeric autotransporter adhesin
MFFVQSFTAQKYILRSVLIFTSILLMALVVGCGSSSSSPTSSGTTINAMAGTGTAGYTGNGAAAASAELNFPAGVALDASGNLYIADANNNVVRKVTTAGTISTIAGNGTAGYTGNGGAATNAELNGPYGVVLDASGNLYIADTNNNVIRKVTTAGTISTVAGTGSSGNTGNGGPATSAKLSGPAGIAVDASGNLYIADSGNNVVRKVTTAGTISLVAGTGTVGYSGIGSVATSVDLSWPVGVAVDASGNIYIADAESNVVLKVTPTGTLTTVAGNGNIGYTGDGGPAVNAELNNPTGVAVDGAGNLYIADTLNNVVRTVTPGGIITTMAGTGTPGYSGNGGPSTKAKLNSPLGIVASGSGTVYVADTSNNVIRTLSWLGLQ